MRIEAVAAPEVAYFATEGFHSEGGLRLAQRCAPAVHEVLAADLGDAGVPVRGMRLPILRRTRMPAVLCTMAPPSSVVTATAELAEALVGAVADWVANPADSPTD